MTRHQVFALIEEMIDETSAAVLVTVDKEKLPHVRWVTPGCIGERQGAIFMVSGSQSAKVEQIRANPSAEMLFQTKTLDKILHVSGRINLLFNPSIRAETLECIGRNLHVFWKITPPESELVVLEFIISGAMLYVPQSGLRETVKFEAES
ncbi:MAG: pyridoxamine 5'-phosphate oxidase family protein [Fibrobacter sp.]|nr:pyridoxamine 5'-phosphate oxidase family protein [Fibrobacter sp.]